MTCSTFPKRLIDTIILKAEPKKTIMIMMETYNLKKLKRLPQIGPQQKEK